MSEAKTNELATAPREAEGGGALIQMIERVALNPEIDVAKMERLLDMQERVLDRQAAAAFAQAMGRAQQRIGPIAADAENPQTRSKYATYAKLDRALRHIYTSEGFSLSFDTGDSPEGCVRVLCYVSHRDGHTRTYHADMPADGLGAKGNAVMTKTHAAGSAMSYGMRYLLKLIFNVAVGEDDDDGNRASAARITDEQAAEIERLIKDVGADRKQFMGWLRTQMNAKSVPELPAQAYDYVVAKLESKRRAAKKEAEAAEGADGMFNR